MADSTDDMDEKDWSKFMIRAELYDVMGMKHVHKIPSTNIKGTRTIDYILATKKAAESIISCGMLTFNEGVVSDHRSLWIDLDIPQLFKGSISPIH